LPVRSRSSRSQNASLAPIPIAQRKVEGSGSELK
jgi:hypothetical protein